MFQNQPFVDSLKKMFVNNSQKSQESTYVGVSKFRIRRSQMFVKIIILKNLQILKESTSVGVFLMKLQAPRTATL